MARDYEQEVSLSSGAPRSHPRGQREHGLSSLLKTGDGIIRQLDDSEDRLWREALNLSIRLGNEDTMDTLLQGVKFDFRKIHEALLVAVDTNQPRVVKRLLDRLDLEKGNKMDVRSFSMAIFDQSIDDSQFAPGVTPLTLACQKDLYDIVTMLNQKGHEIPWPHKISCICLEWQEWAAVWFAQVLIVSYQHLPRNCQPRLPVHHRRRCHAQCLSTQPGSSQAV